MDALYVFSDGDNHPAVVETTYGPFFEDRWMILVLIVSWVTVGLVLMGYATAVMFDEYVSKHRSHVSTCL